MESPEVQCHKKNIRTYQKEIGKHEEALDLLLDPVTPSLDELNSSIEEFNDRVIEVKERVLDHKEQVIQYLEETFRQADAEDKALRSMVYPYTKNDLHECQRTLKAYEYLLEIGSDPNVALANHKLPEYVNNISELRSLLSRVEESLSEEQKTSFKLKTSSKVIFKLLKCKDIIPYLRLDNRPKVFLSCNSTDIQYYREHKKYILNLLYQNAVKNIFPEYFVVRDKLESALEMLNFSGHECYDILSIPYLDA